MLADKPAYTMLPAADLDRSREFYRDVLGLREEMVTEGGVMFSSGGSRLFVYPTGQRPGGHAQLSWLVPDIRLEVAELRARGVQFEESEAPGITTVDGITQSGPNVWTAWFKDPAGNLVGLTQIG